MDRLSGPHVLLTFPAGEIPGFAWLLQCGFLIEVHTCASLRCLLLDELKLSSGFVENAIQSIFLDGKPVDDLDSAHVKDGCTVALSAAMPGLVGATMRRGGFYASLRSGISHTEDALCEAPRGGNVTIKLFNLVAPELESSLMAKGIWVRGDVLKDFFKSRPAEFWARCELISVNGGKIAADELMGMAWPQGLSWLKVETSRSA
jgi:hypothetical protein